MWEQRFKAYVCHKQWNKNSLDNDNFASNGFFKLLRCLQVIFLQDLAVLQPQFPTLPFFLYALFRGFNWAAFAKKGTS